MISIDITRCIGCGQCAWDCFPGAITQENGTPALTNPVNCIGCGHCIAICPKAAVSDDSLPMEDSFPAQAEKSPSELLTLMRARRSCRHYKTQPVSAEELSFLLEAARSCPTAKNLQATRYIAVTENIPALLDAALEALGKVGKLQRTTASAPDEIRRANNFIRWSTQRETDKTFDPLFFHAPMLLLFVSPKEAARDAAAAAAYTELMAASLGLGCLYSGYFTACASGNQKIHDLLHIAAGEEIVRCLVLGHPDIRFQRTAPRKPVNIDYK